MKVSHLYFHVNKLMAWLNRDHGGGGGTTFIAGIFFLPELIIRGLLFTSTPVDMEKSSPGIIGL